MLCLFVSVFSLCLPCPALCFDLSFFFVFFACVHTFSFPSVSDKPLGRLARFRSRGECACANILYSIFITCTLRLRESSGRRLYSFSFLTTTQELKLPLTLHLPSVFTSSTGTALTLAARGSQTDRSWLAPAR